MTRLDARGPWLVGPRLSLMMLMQYAMWGVWLPIIGRYLTSPVGDGGLGFSLSQMGWILGGAAAVGSLTAPFLAGQLADRILNAERALGLLLIAAGLVQWLLAQQTAFVPWLLLSMLYSVLYLPTLSLTNGVAFANLRRSEHSFPLVRSVGTAGWILASVVFPLIFLKTDLHFTGVWPFVDGAAVLDGISRIRLALVVSGVVGMVYGLYCLTLLPATPPTVAGGPRSLAFAGAFGLLTRPMFLPLVLAALLLSIVQRVYFMRTGNYLTERLGLSPGDIAPLMALGQVSEIVVLAGLGLILGWLGFKRVLMVGAAATVLFYVMLAVADSPTVVRLAMVLKGLHIGCFFITAFMLVERFSPRDIRHSAQTVFGMLGMGLGPIIAGVQNYALELMFTRGMTTDYTGLWLVQAGLALLALLIVGLGLRLPSRPLAVAPPGPDEVPPEA